jgi:hypothetical protein
MLPRLLTSKPRRRRSRARTSCSSVLLFPSLGDCKTVTDAASSGSGLVSARQSVAFCCQNGGCPAAVTVPASGIPPEQ